MRNEESRNEESAGPATLRAVVPRSPTLRWRKRRVADRFGVCSKCEVQIKKGRSVWVLVAPGMEAMFLCKPCFMARPGLALLKSIWEAVRWRCGGGYSDAAEEIGLLRATHGVTSLLELTDRQIEQLYRELCRSKDPQRTQRKGMRNRE